MDIQDRCLYCGASEHSFIHPEYNCKWVRIYMHGTGGWSYKYLHVLVAMYMHGYIFSDFFVGSV